MTGWRALFYKEVLRFWKVSAQTIAAPVLTALSEIDGTSRLGLDPFTISWQASQVQRVPGQNQTNA